MRLDRPLSFAQHRQSCSVHIKNDELSRGKRRERDAYVENPLFDQVFDTLRRLLRHDRCRLAHSFELEILVE